VIPVRKSLWLPLALGVLLLLLIAGAQVGLRRHDLALLLLDSLEFLVPLLWVPIGIAAIFVWRRTGEAAAGYFTLAMAPHAVAMIFSAIALLPGQTQLHLVRYMLLPLQPIGLALATLTWAKEPRGLPRQALTILTAATAAGHYLYLFTVSLHGATQGVAGAVQLIQTAYWAVLVAVAWKGYRREPRQTLLWMSLLALCLGLHSLSGTISLLLPMAASFFSMPLFYLMSLLSLIAAGGVLSSAAKEPNPGK
jgi:hypothetical protein